MADGDITPLHSFEHDHDYPNDACTIKISDNIVALVYRGNGVIGHVRTVAIDDDGVMSNLHTYAFGRCLDPHIIHVNGTVYAIVYRHIDSKGYIRTINIDSAGVITGIANHQFTDPVMYAPFIMHTSGNVYMIIHNDNYGGFHSYISTVNINQDGTNIHNIHKLRFTDLLLLKSTACHITGTKYAVAHSDGSIRCVIRTFDISATGHISYIHDWVCANSGGAYPRILKLSNGVFAVAYCGVTWIPSNIKITTFGIEDSGNITGQKHYYDTLSGGRVDLWFVHSGGDIFSLVCRTASGSSNGDIYTVGIAKNGTIPGNMDSYRIIGSHCTMPYIMYLHGNIHTVAYSSFGNAGAINTYDINAPSDAITARPPRFTTGLSHRSFH